MAGLLHVVTGYAQKVLGEQFQNRCPHITSSFDAFVLCESP